MAKLAFLINSLGGGGSERLLQTMTTDFVQRGHNVSIFTLEEASAAYEFSPAVCIVPLWTRVLNRGAGKILSLPLIALELRFRLGKERPDGWMSFMYRSNFAAVLARILGYRGRLIVSEHVDIDLCYPEGSFSSKIMRGLTRLLYPLADNVLAVSQGVRDSLCRLGVGPDKVTVIHNVVDQSQMRVDAATAQCDGVSRLQQSATFINVGRLCAQKNQSLLLHAVSLLRTRGHSVELQLVGDGPDLAMLRRIVQELKLEDVVHFLGWRSHPYNLMARARAFVLSSDYEGFGIVLVEAMACGLPVISTDCPSGPAEILGHGRYGDLVPVGDVVALAAAMERLILDEDHRRANQEKSLRRARDFDIREVGAKYLSLILGNESAA